MRITSQTMIGDRSKVPEPIRTGGMRRRIGRNTGSVIASKNLVIDAKADPGDAGT